MTFIFTSYQSLLLPLVAFGAYVGWQRGFWQEVGYTLGMALVLLASVIFPDQFIGFISRVVLAIPRVFNILFGLNFSLPDASVLFGAPETGQFLLSRVVLFSLLAFLVYSTRYGWAYDGGKARAPKNNGGKIMGGLFGAASGFFWFLALNNFLDAFRRLRDDPRIPPEGTTISIPTIQNPDLLLGFVPTLLVITLIVLGVLAVLRLPNIWKG